MNTRSVTNLWQAQLWLWSPYTYDPPYCCNLSNAKVLTLNWMKKGKNMELDSPATTEALGLGFFNYYKTVLLVAFKLAFPNRFNSEGFKQSIPPTIATLPKWLAQISVIHQSLASVPQSDNVKNPAKIRSLYLLSSRIAWALYMLNTLECLKLGSFSQRDALSCLFLVLSSFL